MSHDNETFLHKCLWSDCSTIIAADNQPWCVLHVPLTGAVVEGYSAKTAVEMLSPYEIVTELLNELMKQKQKGGQLRFSGFEDLSLKVKIEMAKAWLQANVVNQT